MMACLNYARARGRKMILRDKGVGLLKLLAKDKTISISTICDRFGISRRTYYNYLKIFR